MVKLLRVLIITHELIEYVMDDERKVIVQFEENNSQTTVNISFEAENENDIEMQKAGWQAILNSFKSYVELN